MAIAFRAIGTAASGTGAITPGLPAGHTTDDILVLVVQTSNQAVAAPSGYTQIANSPQGTGSAGFDGCGLQVFWKRDGGSEAAPTVADAGDHTYASILAFSGCIATGDPVDASAGSVKATSNSSHSITPGVTTTVDATMVIACISCGASITGGPYFSQANANLTNVALRANVGPGAVGQGGSYGVVTGEKATAGATGTTSISGSTTGKDAMLTLALKPPAAAAAIYPFTRNKADLTYLRM